MRVYEHAAIGDEDHPQPSYDPSFTQNAKGLDPEIGPEDAVDNNGNLRGPYTRPPHNGTYAIATDGFVMLVYLSPILKSTC